MTELPWLAAVLLKLDDRWRHLETQLLCEQELNSKHPEQQNIMICLLHGLFFFIEKELSTLEYSTQILTMKFEENLLLDCCTPVYTPYIC